MITILTPTYNRAYTLTRLYNSLLVQNREKFEWVIVDDGSTDKTSELINSFISDQLINIKYFYQDNQGKPSAINFGVKNSSGSYVFIVDSDDMVTQDCIKILEEKIEFHEMNQDVFSGICFRKGNIDGTLLGRSIENLDANYMLYHSTDLKNDLNVDLAYCFKKNLLLENPFPKIGKEKFVPELYIWNKITDMAKVYLYPNTIIYLVEYLPDGLTADFKKQLKKYPRGFLLYYKDQFLREKSLKNKIKMLIRVTQCNLYKYMRKE